jgi:hypothetical protein
VLVAPRDGREAYGVPQINVKKSLDRPSRLAGGKALGLPLEFTAMASTDLLRDRILATTQAVLERHGVPAGGAEVGLRSFGGTDGKVPGIMVFVRLNVWCPDVLLQGKILEKRIRDTLWQELQVRAGYVFWRIGSDVDTPYDHTEEFPARPRRDRVASLMAEAQARGSTLPDSAPITDWSDIDAPPDPAPAQEPPHPLGPDFPIKL